MSRGRGLIFALALAIFAFGVDQATKRLVEGSMRIGESVPAVEGVLSFTYIKNPGGAFGILDGSQLVLVIGSFVAVAVVLWMLLASPPSRMTVLGCGLILGGAAGNLFDRITAGEVTDYMDLQFWPLEQWAIFNAADTAIVVGVAALLIGSFFPQRSGETGADSKN
ncbi:MAG: signal peptidase II [Rubrobacteraceae bacterium]